MGNSGIANVVAALVETTAALATMLSAKGTDAEGSVDEELRRRLTLVVQHAQRALKVARLLERQAETSRNLRAALDAVEAAVFLVLPTGIVARVNSEVERLLRQDDVAGLVHGRLVLTDTRATTKFAASIRTVASGNGANGTPGHSILAPGRAGRMSVITVMPLTPGPRRSVASAWGAAVVVCIEEVEFKVPGAVSTLTAHYQLKKRETAILVAMVELAGAKEVALTAGLSEATVRTHVKSIFGKTGSRRQSDLVKLVAGVAGPLGVRIA